MGRGAVDHGRADCGDGEMGLVFVDVGEGGFFGVGFAGEVGEAGVCFFGLFQRQGVPVAFGVGVAWPVGFCGVEDCGYGGG